MRIRRSAVEPHPMLSCLNATFADTPALPFSTRDKVPRSQHAGQGSALAVVGERAVSPRVQPASSMFSGIRPHRSAQVGGRGIQDGANALVILERTRTPIAPDVPAATAVALRQPRGGQEERPVRLVEG